MKLNKVMLICVYVCKCVRVEQHYDNDLKFVANLLHLPDPSTIKADNRKISQNDTLEVQVFQINNILVGLKCK